MENYLAPASVGKSRVVIKNVGAIGVRGRTDLAPDAAKSVNKPGAIGTCRGLSPSSPY